MAQIVGRYVKMRTELKRAKARASNRRYERLILEPSAGILEDEVASAGQVGRGALASSGAIPAAFGDVAI
jgi:hypothetical protein